MTPETLQRYPPGKNLRDDIGQWAIAYVKTRQEKALARDLAAMHIPYYMPLVSHLRWKAMDKQITNKLIPLFQNYLPFAGVQKANQVYLTGRVIDIIKVEDQSRFIEEMIIIQTVLSSAYDYLISLEVPIGRQVEITQGPLKGLVGQIEESAGNSVFVVGIEMFKQYIRVHLNIHFMKILPN